MTTVHPNRFREVAVQGTAREIGQQIGEHARDEVRGFAEVALERVNKTMRVTRDTAIAIAHRCIDFVSDYSIDMLSELRGMSESSGVPLDDLMLLQVRNQLTDSLPQSGCTSLAVAGCATESGNGIVAQNWDNDPLLDEFTIVLTRRPTGKPALMTVTQAGLIAYIGMNDAGIGCCLNTLPAPSREVGVPHYFTLRGIYEADSLAAATHAVKRAQRAVPANIMMITPDGPADLEVTIDDVHVLQPQGEDSISHTNHCLHLDLVPVNDKFPELIESHPRLDRICGQLSSLERPINVKQIQTMLSDHSGHPKSICRHENDHPVNGFWTTVLSVIIEPDAGEMHISRGTPCNHPYETYQL